MSVQLHSSPITAVAQMAISQCWYLLLELWRAPPETDFVHVHTKSILWQRAPPRGCFGFSFVSCLMTTSMWQNFNWTYLICWEKSSHDIKGIKTEAIKLWTPSSQSTQGNWADVVTLWRSDWHPMVFSERSCLLHLAIVSVITCPCSDISSCPLMYVGILVYEIYLVW